MIYPTDLEHLMQTPPNTDHTPIHNHADRLTPDEIDEALHNLATTRMRARLASDHKLVRICDEQAARITGRIYQDS